MLCSVLAGRMFIVVQQTKTKREGTSPLISFFIVFHFAICELGCMVCLPVSLLGHFPSLRYVQGSTTIGVFEGGYRTVDTCQINVLFYVWSQQRDIRSPPTPMSCHASLGFLFHFSLLLFCNKLIESVRMMACVVRLSPLEAVQRRAWETASTFIVKLEVETCSSGIMDGGRTLLDSEAPRRLVFGD